MSNFDHLNFRDFVFPSITVYRSPRDFAPGQFVARIFDFELPTPHYIVKPTLDEIRACIPKHFVRMSRDPADEPHIIEIWI